MGTAQLRLVLAGALVTVMAGCSPGGSPAASTIGSTSASSIPSTATPSPSPEAPSPTPEEAGLTGNWSGTWTIDAPYNTSGDWKMEIVQSGGAFSGTVELTNTDCSDGTVQGTVDGSNVNFGWITSTQPIQFAGTLNGTSMSGTWSAYACSDATTALTGTWEGTKQP